MSKRVLLTGITGFFGSYLAKALLAEGNEVIALKRKCSSLKRIESILSEVDLYNIEGLDFAELFQSQEKIDVIIHTAACLGRSGEEVAQIVEGNTIFPLNLLDAAAFAGVGTFINSGTTVDRNLSVYSLSKDQFLQWGRFYSMHHGIRFLNMRLELLYGPGDDDSKFTAHIIKNCIENTPEMKLTLGEQKRDFIYIDDAVFAYLTVLKKMEPFSDMFMEYDIGSGKAVSIRKMIETVHLMTKSKSHLAFGAIPYGKKEMMISSAEIGPLLKLGWRCETSLEQGIQLTIDSFK